MPSRRALAWHAAATLAAITLTAFCLTLLVTDAMAKSLRAALPTIRAWPLVLSLFVSILINEVRSRRFLLALGARGLHARAAMFRVCAMLVVLTNLLPFKIGELSFPVLARRALDVGYAESLGVLVYSRVMDLLAVIALGGFALAAARPGGATPLDRAALPVAALATLALVALPALVTRAHDLGRRLAVRPRLRDALDRLFLGCRAVAAPREHAAWLGLTFASWILQAACAHLVMIALGVRPSILDGPIASAAAALAFAFPIHGIAGVGPMQAAWAYALAHVGWAFEPAVATAFLSHATIFASAVVIAAAAVIGQALHDRR